MSIGSRIKELRNKQNMTQEELAQKIGVTKGAIANYENGVSSPKIELMYKLFDALDCDANYLHQDDMKKIAFKDTSTPDEFENIIKKYRFVSENNPEGLKAVDYILSHEYSVAQKLKENKDQIKDAAPQHSSAALRIYTYMRKIAAAGTGFYFDDIPTDTIEAPYLEGADFIIGVSGDSMEPDYHDGDKLYVKKVEHLNYGEVGIFTINNECYLKEFGSGGLISRNKDYENIPGSEDIRLIGKVIDKLD